MRIDFDKNFKRFSDIAGKTMSEMEAVILNNDKDLGILQDIEELYGATIQEFLEWEAMDYEPKVRLLTGVDIDFQMLNLFLQVRVLGDGVCPNCGSDNYDVNNDYNIITHHFDYDLPDSSCIDIVKNKICCNCKECFTLY